MVQLGKKPVSWGTFVADSVCAGTVEAGHCRQAGIYVAFEVEAGEALSVKAASSFVDEAGALVNLEAEIPHWDFEQTRHELTDIWNRRFSLVEVETPDRDARSMFYGAFYRASF